MDTPNTVTSGSAALVLIKQNAAKGKHYFLGRDKGDNKPFLWVKATPFDNKERELVKKGAKPGAVSGAVFFDKDADDPNLVFCGLPKRVGGFREMMNLLGGQPSCDALKKALYAPIQAPQVVLVLNKGNQSGVLIQPVSDEENNQAVVESEEDIRKREDQEEEDGLETARLMQEREEEEARLFDKNTDIKNKLTGPTTKLLNDFADKLGDTELGAVPDDDFGAPVRGFSKARIAWRLAVSTGDYLKAPSVVGDIKTAIQFYNSLLGQQKDRWTKLKSTIDGVERGIAAERYTGLDDEIEAFRDAAKEAARLAVDPANAVALSGAAAAMNEVELKLVPLRSGAAKSLIARGKKKSAKSMREEISRQLVDDPNVLDTLVREDGGNDLLDELVGDLGQVVKASPDREFLKSAMKARFDLEVLSGDLTTKALPRMYKLFNKVPDSHTQFNDRLKKVHRDKKSTEASFYASSSNKIVLNLERVGKGTQGFDCDDEVPEEIRPLKGKVPYFDHTTLHEIGHAVDDRLKFMTAKTNIEQYGGWMEHTIEEIADVACDKKSFYADFPLFPQPLLKEFLVEMLKGGKPLVKVVPLLKSQDPVPSKPEVERLIGHQAVLWCQAIKLVNDDTGLWEKGASSKDYEIDGRVYQQAYTNRWVSYKSSTRAKGVSSYQFRAAGEWFAEIYATFYVGKLPPKHPDQILMSLIEKM